MLRSNIAYPFHVKPIIALALAIAAAHPASSAPNGGTVVGGSGTISQDGTLTTVNQSTDRLAIDWQSFSVGADERVQFIQPGSDAIALNRVLGNHASEILGQIDANGHIVLVNPNGILFSESATIDVGGLVASGLRIDPTKFINGELLFSDKGSDLAKVVNRGIINAAAGGNVALLGRQVANEGLISAELGTVTLAAGRAAVLTFDSSGLLGVRVSKETLHHQLGVDPAVSNSGEINAPLGRVLLTASASQDVFSKAVNTDQLDGEIRVAVHADGSFTLGKGAPVINTGSIDISGDSSASVDASAVVMLGSDVRHSGDIQVGSVGANHHAEVIIASSGRTRLQGDAAITEIHEATDANAKVTVLGKQVALEDETRIELGSDSIIQLGGPDSDAPSRLVATDRTFVGKNVKLSATPGGAHETFGSGGEISVWSRHKTVVEGALDVRGLAPNNNDTTGAGGTVVLASLGTLGYSGSAHIGAGNTESEDGQLRLQARQLSISNDNTPTSISQSSLQYSMMLGDVALEARERVGLACEEPISLGLGFDLNISAQGSDGKRQGVIDLQNLALYSNYLEGYWSTRSVRLESGGDLRSPAVTTTPGAEIAWGDAPGRVNVYATSHHGSVLHSANITTFGGHYIARAKHDLRFQAGASLDVNESWGSGLVYIEAGETVDLPVIASFPRDFEFEDADYDPTDPVYAGPALKVSGRDVDLWAKQGLTGGDISAENLVLTVDAHPLNASDPYITANVSGHIDITGREGANLTLWGTFNTLTLDAAADSHLAVFSATDLFVGDVTARDGALVSLYASYPGGTGSSFTQLPNSRIDIARAYVAMTGMNLSLGAAGTSTLTVDQGTADVFTGNSLSLNGKATVSNGGNFRASTFNGPNEVTVGHHAEFDIADPMQFTVSTSIGDDIINLYADAPISFRTEEGLDTIYILSPDVTQLPTVIDRDEYVIVPYMP